MICNKKSKIKSALRTHQAQMGCSPPKCVKRKSKCHCPNSWIEFLAHEARSRKSKNIASMSLKQYAMKYRERKRAGIFSSIKSSSMSKNDCKGSNTKRLCNWYSQRTLEGSKRDNVRKLSRIDVKRIKKSMLILEDPGIQNIDGGQHVKIAKIQGVPVIIKVFSVNNQAELNDFLYTTKAHKVMTESISNSVPHLYYAYLLKTGREILGVHIMECLRGVTLETYVANNNEDVPDLHKLAKSLKKLVDDLASCKIYHFDFHWGNVIVDVDHRNAVVSAKAIDLDDVRCLDRVPHENPFSLLRVSEDDSIERVQFLRKLITAYLRLDRTLPRDMATWEVDEFYQVLERNQPERIFSHLQRVPIVDA